MNKDKKQEGYPSSECPSLFCLISAMRETGFYWVLPKHDDEWQIATWRADEESWYVTGLSYELTDSAFREIDERKIVRE